MRRAAIKQEDVKLSSSGKLLRRMLIWTHEAEIAQGFPYSLMELQKLTIAQLRFVARMCPSWVHQEMLHQTRAELIQWILGDQPQAPASVGRPPVRAADVPTLDEIRPPRR